MEKKSLCFLKKNLDIEFKGLFYSGKLTKVLPQTPAESQFHERMDDRQG